MKIGDLVLCPTVGDAIDEWHQESYVGIIINICGHKVDVAGGPKGTEVWDIFDLRKEEFDINAFAGVPKTL